MAFPCSCKISILIILSSSLLFYCSDSSEFLVGDETGWGVPKKDEHMFNEWASRNRFKVNDTVKFKYKKDSVLVVGEEEYKKCHSSHPLFFSNNGDTEFNLDRPGLFYFISGIAGHCERGLKMIIKVLEPEAPDHSGNDSAMPAERNAAPQMSAIASAMMILLNHFLIALFFVFN